MTDNAATVFQRLFQHENIARIYQEKISPRPTRGIDRISVQKFDTIKNEQFAIVGRKCLNGVYRFSPYLERLQLKGRDRKPRTLSVATIRDRIVLYLLKEFLHELFPECIGRRVPNAYIREIRRVLAENDGQLSFIKADIKSFYDTIDQRRLFTVLRPRVGSLEALTLLRRAVRSPTVSLNYRKSDRGPRTNRRGVPQGLAISNILANISLLELDQRLQTATTAYFRYVDDMLLLTQEAETEGVTAFLHQLLHDMGLEISEQKTTSGEISVPFDYLGYRFAWPTITVRPTTVERFLHSIVRQFATFKHGTDPRARDNKWLNRDMLRQIFVDEVNERITGAINGNRRYGWLFYFLEITDLRVLHMIDAVVASFFKRLPTFNGQAPDGLKKASKAYFAAKHDPRGGYILDYNSYDTLEKKLEYLRRRGYLNPASQEIRSVPDLERLFERVKHRNLASLEADVGVIS